MLDAEENDLVILAALVQNRTLIFLTSKINS